MKPKIAFCIALTCAAALASSASAEPLSTSSHAKHHARHAPRRVSGAIAPAPAEQAQNNAAASSPFSWLTQLFPNVKPYPPGQGDVDGLSRNPEDCNKGCVDNSRR